MTNNEWYDLVNQRHITGTGDIRFVRVFEIKEVVPIEILKNFIGPLSIVKGEDLCINRNGDGMF
jgi:hypothetical protein